MPKGEGDCPITGLQVAKLRGKLSKGICGYLAGILYVGAVQKSVERWSFWHDREVLLTAQRLVIADEEGNLKRFHSITSISSATLTGDSRIHISIADGDLLLAFPSQMHLQRFVEILREVMTSLSQHPFEVTFKREVKIVSSPKGSPRASPILRHSKVGKPNDEIHKQMKRDHEVLNMMRVGKTCPATSLPFVSPPRYLRLPNVRVLYSETVTKLTKRGKQNTRICIITYQKLVIVDPDDQKRLKRNHTTYDVHSLRYCSVDNRMVILIEMLKGKDILLYFESDSPKSSTLMSVITTLKGVQRDAAKSIFKGIRRVEHEAELRITGPSSDYTPPTGGCDIFSLRGTHRQDVGLTRGPSRGNERRSQSPTGPSQQRTEQWQQQLQNVSFEGLPANPNNITEPSCGWSLFSLDSAGNDVTQQPVVNIDSNIWGKPTLYEELTVPCDPSTCITCASMKQQIKEICPVKNVLNTNSAATTTTATTATNSSSSIVTGRKQSRLREEIASLRQKIEFMEAQRATSMESVDNLIQKLQKNNISPRTA